MGVSRAAATETVLGKIPGNDLKKRVGTLLFPPSVALIHIKIQLSDLYYSWHTLAS